MLSWPFLFRDWWIDSSSLNFPSFLILDSREANRITSPSSITSVTVKYSTHVRSHRLWLCARMEYVYIIRVPTATFSPGVQDSPLVRDGIYMSLFSFSNCEWRWHFWNKLINGRPRFFAIGDRFWNSNEVKGSDFAGSSQNRRSGWKLESSWRLRQELSSHSCRVSLNICWRDFLFLCQHLGASRSYLTAWGVLSSLQEQSTICSLLKLSKTFDLS